MIYGFQNRKPFSNFKHLIHKSMDPTKTRRDLTRTRQGLARDPIGTYPGAA